MWASAHLQVNIYNDFIIWEPKKRQRQYTNFLFKMSLRCHSINKTYSNHSIAKEQVNIEFFNLKILRKKRFFRISKNDPCIKSAGIGVIMDHMLIRSWSMISDELSIVNANLVEIYWVPITECLAWRLKMPHVREKCLKSDCTLRMAVNTSNEANKFEQRKNNDFMEMTAMSIKFRIWWTALCNCKAFQYILNEFLA